MIEDEYEEEQYVSPRLIRWEDPDVVRDGIQVHREWIPIVKQLKSRPGVYAVIVECSALNTGDIEFMSRVVNNGHGPFAPKGAFQVSRRTYITDPKKPTDSNDYHNYRNKTVALYCRYLTDEQKTKLQADRSRRREKRREGRR